MYIRFDTTGLTIHETYNAFHGKSAVHRTDTAEWLRITRESAAVERTMAYLRAGSVRGSDTTIHVV